LPFFFNRLPVFLEKLPVSGRKTGRGGLFLCVKRLERAAAAGSRFTVVSLSVIHLSPQADVNLNKN
jgi:hypothetical protein